MSVKMATHTGSMIVDMPVYIEFMLEELKMCDLLEYQTDFTIWPDGSAIIVILSTFEEDKVAIEATLLLHVSCTGSQAEQKLQRFKTELCAKIQYLTAEGFDVSCDEDHIKIQRCNLSVRSAE